MAATVQWRRVSEKIGFIQPILYVVERLVEIQKSRNEFAHEGLTNVRFENFFASIIGTVAFLYFFLLPSKKQLSVYPFSDFEHKFR